MVSTGWQGPMVIQKADIVWIHLRENVPPCLHDVFVERGPEFESHADSFVVCFSLLFQFRVTRKKEQWLGLVNSFVTLVTVNLLKRVYISFTSVGTFSLLQTLVERLVEDRVDKQIGFALQLDFKGFPGVLPY